MGLNYAHAMTLNGNLVLLEQKKLIISFSKYIIGKKTFHDFKSVNEKIWWFY
jgi:hypothetical protein